MKKITVRMLVLCMLVATMLATTVVGLPAGAQGSEKPTGDPVKVMAMGPFSDPSTGFEYPEWPAAAKARAKYVNTHGFLEDTSGETHRLEVLTCDAGIDANLAEQCARKAVDEGVVALVGYNGPSGAVIIPILEAAGIPFIGNYPNDVLATASPISFPLVSGGAGLFAGLPLQLQSLGADKQSYVISDLGGTTTGFINLMVSATGEKDGIDILDQTILSADQLDMAPVVASATDDGAQGIGMFLVGDASKNFINTVAQGGNDQSLGTIAPFISQQYIDDLGDAADGLVVTATTRFTKKTKGGRMYASDMKAYDADLPLNDAGADYWMSTWVFERVAETLPTIDAASVLDAMGKLNNFSTGGMTPPISTDTEFAGDSPVPLPRLYNPTVVYYEVKNSKLVEVDGKFVNPFDTQ